MVTANTKLLPYSAVFTRCYELIEATKCVTACLILCNVGAVCFCYCMYCSAGTGTCSLQSSRLFSHSASLLSSVNVNLARFSSALLIFCAICGRATLLLSLRAIHSSCEKIALKCTCKETHSAHLISIIMISMCTQNIIQIILHKQK
jgi:hypothetical protein